MQSESQADIGRRSMATVIGWIRLKVFGPFERAFAQCAGCDQLVQDEVKFGCFCCISCSMMDFESGHPIEQHGDRCEDRLANEVDANASRDLYGNRVIGSFIAEPALSCKTVCGKKVQSIFKEAGLELAAYVDQNQDSVS